MQAQIAQWLREHSLPDHTAIESMTPGLGTTALWRISGASGQADLVLRMFPQHGTDVAKREELAMRAAQEQRIPVPSIHATGMIAGRPVMLTSFAPGRTVAAEMKQAPERAHEVGRQLGVLLGELHAIPAPPDLAPPGRWITRGGDALKPLHARLRALPMANRLLHLDYHPENVMMLDGQVSAIIDWTNTLQGPPHIDLARSRSIVVAATMSGAIPTDRQAALTGFMEGLVSGHLDAFGPDPHPALSAAWGMAMTVDDLSGHLGKPESWVTAELVAQLQQKRDTLIEACL